MQCEQAVNPKQFLSLPPMFPTNLMPEDVYSQEEMAIVKDWLKATLWCRGVDDFEKAIKNWSLERRSEVAKILEETRAMGLFPDRVDGAGRIVWGRVLKGHLQVEMDRNGARYDEIGREIVRTRQFRLKTVNEMITEEV